MLNTLDAKRAVCSFRGQYTIIDKDLKQHLIRKLFALAQQYDSIEFLFDREGDFEDLCFLAAMTTKQHFLEKDITITLVLSNEQRTYFFSQIAQGRGHFPHYFADRLLTPPISYTDNPIANGKRVSLWVLQQSTHLVRYLYRELDSLASKEYSSAKKIECTILDVTSEETAALLSDEVASLPERDQLILKKSISGEKKAQIGKQLDLSVHVVDRSLSRSSISLSRSLRHRLCTQDDFSSPICGIFSMGKTDFMIQRLLNLAIWYLVHKCSVSKFLVTAEYCRPENMYSLGPPADDAEITVVTTASNWKSPPPSSGSPPYQNVEVLEDPKREDVLYPTKVILKRADICLCDLSNNPQAPYIKAYLSQLDRVTVFDLGQVSRTKTWNPDEWSL